jgi:hypothetical protein
MARPDKVYTRFRGVVATAITGVWGDDAAPDLACVMLDASGNLVVADQGEALGVIWTPEGKAHDGVANYNVAAAGSVMTVFVQAEFVGAFDENTSSDAVTVGDLIFSDAAGATTVTPPAAPTQQIGFMVASSEGDPRVILNVATIGDVV